MSERELRSALPLRRSGAASGRLRLITTWTAIFALYVQLAAILVCAGALPAGASGGFDRFASAPICHSQVGAQVGAQVDAQDDAARKRSGDHVPANPHSCAFCTLHCCADVVASPQVEHPAPAHVAAVTIDRPAFIVRSHARAPTDAAPRGPPRTA